MFYKEAREQIYKTTHTTELLCERILEAERKIEAIIECVNGDRKDINALITLWRNNKKTSEKKGK